MSPRCNILLLIALISVSWIALAVSFRPMLQRVRLGPQRTCTMPSKLSLVMNSGERDDLRNVAIIGMCKPSLQSALLVSTDKLYRINPLEICIL